VKSSKRTRKLQQRKKHKNKPRRNPAWPGVQLLGTIPDFVKKGSTLEIDIYNDTSGFGDFAADMFVRSALIGCTTQEKMAIAALIPMLIKAVRKLPPADPAPETAKQP
jgi:hypothetical protein